MHTVYKKGISIILVMLMVFGGLNGVFIGGEKAYAADGFVNGTGTPGDPYLIATAAELDLIRSYLEEGTYFKLIADIDLTEYLSVDGAGYNGGAGWVPIGIDIDRFNGSLDGNGFKIMNLFIDLPAGDRVGFFGVTGAPSTITNIILENIDVEGNSFVGSLAAENFGTISSSSVTGSVYSFDSATVGGLVGFNNVGGIINSSYSAVSVSADVSYVIGGLVGLNVNATINDSYATGNVNGFDEVGGLVGSNQEGGTINNSCLKEKA